MEHLFYLVMVTIHFCAACNFGPGCTFPCHCSIIDQPCNKTTGVCSSGCKVGWSGAGCLLKVNIAIRRPVTQSTTGHTDYPASYAVDGSTAIRGCARPAAQHHDSPVWWRVQFDGIFRVTDVILYTESYENGRKLTAYLSNSSDPLDVQNHIYCQNKTIRRDYQGVSRFGCPQSAIGSSLVLYREYEESHTMSLCEVVVEGHLYSDCTGCGTTSTDTNSCNPEYGCIQNCDKGKRQDSFCLNDCPQNTYGRNCGQTCDTQHCKHSVQYGDFCEPVGGRCPEGCSTWYIGKRCKTNIPLPRLSNNNIEAMDLTSSAMTIQWSPEEYASNLQQYYGYRVYVYNYANRTRNDVYRNNTDETAYSSIVLGGLSYNTEYAVRVYPFRHHQNIINEIDCIVLVQKTPCKEPSAVTVIEYEQQQIWNGSSEIGLLYFKIPDESGCDDLTSVSVMCGIVGATHTESYNLETFDTTTNFSILVLTELGSYNVWMTATNNQDLLSDSNILQVVVTDPGNTGTGWHGLDGDRLQRDIGIALGCLVFIAVVIIVVIIVLRKKKKVPTATLR